MDEMDPGAVEMALAALISMRNTIERLSASLAEQVSPVDAVLELIDATIDNHPNAEVDSDQIRREISDLYDLYDGRP